ncbi:MAG TPA: hypothetical protein DDW49_05485 [Deltaproteobacteria bacterium]|nr:MAG: hypothetical protein A2048_06200 [Deltaproteobacteria bacterium GWA2_45_12]HBF12827.1 hypothetical protein [Deltaproteobacteria bacterium]
MDNRKIHVAKYLSDISKLTIGVGVVPQAFSLSPINWTQFNLALASGILFFSISLLLYKKEP